MNLAVVPYHDWRKILVEGNRTRDAHFIEHFRSNEGIDKLIILNRPITFPELIFYKKLKSIKGHVLLSNKGLRLIQIDMKTYVIDFISSNFLEHIIKKRDWYFKAYTNKLYVEFIFQAYKYLGIENVNYISFNIYAVYLFDKIKSSKIIFDAWDNFVKFPFSKSHLENIKKAYISYAKNANYWTTNSDSNISYYNDNYSPNNIKLITNGVDVDRFIQDSKFVPDDLKKIPAPIIGFGGKITHLFDVSLFNYLVSSNPDKSFVIVGQILNKSIFKKIKKAKNFYYLGDKSYDIYPQYVINFNICIIPYVIDKYGHGANTIKAYEYISTQNKTVGTSSSGINKLSKYIYVCNDKDDFSNCLKDLQNKKEKFSDETFYWKFKVKEILNIFGK